MFEGMPTPRELRLLREAYAETYPVRPLLNALDEACRLLRNALGPIEHCGGLRDGRYVAIQAFLAEMTQPGAEI